MQTNCVPAKQATQLTADENNRAYSICPLNDKLFTYEK